MSILWRKIAKEGRKRTKRPVDILTKPGEKDMLNREHYRRERACAMKRVIVIGAGPAGLTAAYELLDGSGEYEVIVL